MSKWINTYRHYVPRKKEVPCKNCGIMIIFYSRRSGKRYPVDPLDGKPHKCTPTPKTERSKEK